MPKHTNGSWAAGAVSSLPDWWTSPPCRQQAVCSTSAPAPVRSRSPSPNGSPNSASWASTRHSNTSLTPPAGIASPLAPALRWAMRSSCVSLMPASMPPSPCSCSTSSPIPARRSPSFAASPGRAAKSRPPSGTTARACACCERSGMPLSIPIRTPKSSTRNTCRFAVPVSCPLCGNRGDWKMSANSQSPSK